MRGKYVRYSENTQKVFNFKRIWTNGECRVVFVHRSVSEYAESINPIRRICRKNLCIYGEHEKSLSANPNSAIFKINPQIRKFLENTPQLFPKTVPKVVFVNVFDVQI